MAIFFKIDRLDWNNWISTVSFHLVITSARILKKKNF